MPARCSLDVERRLLASAPSPASCRVLPATAQQRVRAAAGRVHAHARDELAETALALERAVVPVLRGVRRARLAAVAGVEDTRLADLRRVVEEAGGARALERVEAVVALALLGVLADGRHVLAHAALELEVVGGPVVGGSDAPARAALIRPRVEAQ